MDIRKERVDKKVKDLDKKITPWLWIFGILLIFTPFLLTRNWFGWIDFSKTGEIGDTIGGTLAPLVGLIGAILVYISFREQYKANISQWEALAEETRIRKDEQLERKKKDNLDLMWKIINEDYNKVYKTFQDVALEDKECYNYKVAKATCSYNLSVFNSNAHIIMSLANEYDLSYNYLFALVVRLQITIDLYKTTLDSMQPIVHPEKINEMIRTIQSCINQILE
jgi:gas vesicle protein